MAGEEFATLQAWFAEQIRQQGLDWQNEPMSQDGNSDFDHRATALIRQAEHHWRLRYGFSPSPGQLQKAFYQALYSETSQKSWRQWLFDQLRELGFVSKK